jgi:hypothetical protein
MVKKNNQILKEEKNKYLSSDLYIYKFFNAKLKLEKFSVKNFNFSYFAI